MVAMFSNGNERYSKKIVHFQVLGQQNRVHSPFGPVVHCESYYFLQVSIMDRLWTLLGEEKGVHCPL